MLPGFRRTDHAAIRLHDPEAAHAYQPAAVCLGLLTFYAVGNPMSFAWYWPPITMFGLCAILLARVGAPFDLGGGAETLGVALARDASAVFAAWTERVSGAIHVRRLAPGGIFGVARTIAPRSLLRGHPPATAAGAVAWVNGGGTLLMSRYR